MNENVGPPITALMADYFAGEKAAGLLLFCIGIAALCAATALFPARHELRAFALTLGIFGVLELTIGLGLYLRTDPQVTALLARLTRDEAAFRAAEFERMTVVQRNFVIIQVVWSVFIAASGIAVWMMKGRPTATGIALGILIHAAMFLAFDRIAERRGSIYFDALRSELIPKAAGSGVRQAPTESKGMPAK